jgi:hypothetical protein
MNGKRRQIFLAAFWSVHLCVFMARSGNKHCLDPLILREIQ